MTLGKNRLKLKGERFGRWFVLNSAGSVKTNNGRDALWLCECDCGNIKIIRGRSLKAGKSKSCGCLQKELSFLRLALPESESNRILI